jgi:hypothetical protein
VRGEKEGKDGAGGGGTAAIAASRNGPLAPTAKHNGVTERTEGSASTSACRKTNRKAHAALVPSSLWLLALRR